MHVCATIIRNYTINYTFYIEIRVKLCKFCIEIIESNGLNLDHLWVCHIFFLQASESKIK